MSHLDDIWELLDQLRQNRNRLAHNLTSSSLVQDSAQESAGEVTKKLRDAFIHAANVNPPFRWPDYTPKPIVDFVAKIATRIQPASVLDPRWVSYHFEQESEITHASLGVDDALAMLGRFEEVGE